MSLGAALRRINHAKVAREGLKPQEHEGNMGRNKPIILFIPKKDVIQEAIDFSANTLKLTLPHKVELRIPVWSKGTPEQFLVHIQQALDAIRQKDLLTAYVKVVKDKEECIHKLTKDTEALKNYTIEDENSPEEKAVQKATEAGTHADEVIESIANKVLQLYSNLLTEEAMRSWCKIPGEQIDCSPWFDLFGVEHAEKHKRSWSSFTDCVTFHLLSVFRSDASETQ